MNVKPFNEVIKMKPDAVAKYLRENQSAMIETYSNEEMNAVCSRMFEDVYADEELNIEILDSEATRRQVWLHNHIKIMAEIHRSLMEYSRWPTDTEISERTKLSRVTIAKHIKHFERDKYFSLHRQKFKLAEESTLNMLYRDAHSPYLEPKERHRAAEMFLKYNRKRVHASESEKSANTFIKVQNVYIDQRTIHALPDDTKRTIEELILNAGKIELTQE